MRTKSFAMLLFVAATTAAGSAFAQGVSIYVGPPAYEDEYANDRGVRAYSYEPRVYGYTRRYRAYDDDASVVVRERRYPSGGCGTYRYWDGDRCVDARYR